MPETLSLHNALTIFQDHLEDIKTAVLENCAWRLENVRPWPSIKGENPLIAEIGSWIIEEEKKQIIAVPVYTVKRIVARQQQAGRVRISSKVSEEMIEVARQHPIEDLYTTTTGFRVRGGMGKCPFHDDNTASFSMRRFNRYRCFGCDAKGSVIDFYMRMHDCDFKTAVRLLNA